MDTFNATDFIARYFVVPTIVTSDGIIGKFDTLQAALEHLQTHGIEKATLSVQVPNGIGAITGERLAALVDTFHDWPPD